VKFDQVMNAGDNADFAIHFTPDGKETQIESIAVEGECANWVTMNRTAPVSLPATIAFNVAVPKDATNGTHRCFLSFMMPGSGMIRYAIGYNVIVNVTGGTEPIPTTEPTTIATTTIPTQPVRETTPRTTYAPIEPVIVIAAIGALLVIRRRP